MKKLFTLIGLVCYISTTAQTTYFSKSSATDFNDLSSWGTAANGSGTEPVSISDADVFVIGNGANMILRDKVIVRSLYIGSVAGFVPAASAGSLTISSVDSLIVSLPVGNNATLAIGTAGNLVVDGGVLLINGSLNHSAGQLAQSGGRIIVDGNSGNVVTSVAGGTPLVRLTSNLLLTGGSIMIANPHSGTSSTSYTLSYNSTGNVDIGTDHTLLLGDSASALAGGVPEGFHLNLTASTGRLRLGSMIVNGGSGPNRWVKITSTGTNPQLTGDLIINPSSEYRMINSSLSVAGNILNNGTLTTSGTLELRSSNNQTVGGSGVFRNSITATTANFTSLTITNTSTTGITFVGAAWSSEASTVSGQFSTSAPINMPVGDTFTLGTAPNLPGTYISGTGGFTGGTVRRWLGVRLISMGTAFGEFPFISPTPATRADKRTLFVGTTGSIITGGLMSITYVPAAGNTYMPSFEDGGSTISVISNDKWEISQSNINLGANNWSLSLTGTGLNEFPQYSTVRITGRAGTVFAGNTSTNGTFSFGDVCANKSSIAAGDIGASPTELHFGSQRTYRTAASGNWEDGSTWVGGISPGFGCEGVRILTGNTVTVNSIACSAQFLDIDTGAALILSGSALTIGCNPVRNATLVSNGALVVSEGQLNINGSLRVATGLFTQTGGIITLNGNTGGSATSASGDIVAFEINANLNLTGGTLIIVNPANRSTAYAFHASTAYTASGTHTIQFGDGVAAVAGSSAVGMAINTPSGRFKFNNIVVNNRATTSNNRAVMLNSDVVVRGNLTILPGSIFEVSANQNLSIAGNITNNGTLTASGILHFQNNLDIGNSVATPQIVSGSGVFQNKATSPTANFTNLYFNNNSAGGITFSGTTWNDKASTVSGTLSFYQSLNRINIGTAIFTLGTSVATPATLSHVSGGFTSGTFRRWIGTTAITYSSVNGLFPFISMASDTANAVRNVSVNINGLSAGGTVSIKHTDVPGMAAVRPFTDNGLNIARVSNSSWTVGNNGLNPGTATFGVRLSGEGVIMPANPFTTRITGATASILTVGSNDTGSGTPAIPQASKNATTVSSFYTARPLYLGIPQSFISTQSGPYEAATTWAEGIVPSLCDNVIIDEGDTVTVNTVPAACADLFINATGALVQNGSTITVGCGGNHTSVVTNFGTLIQNDGLLTINGAYVQNAASAVLNETGGTFVIDGNDAGNIPTSMRLNSPLLAVTAGKLNLSGGTMVLTDPPASYNTTPTMNITLADSAKGTHVLQLGDGISTDLGRGTNGIYLKAPSFKFKHLVVRNNNTPAAGYKRHASIADNFSVLGDITIDSNGDLRSSTDYRALSVGGNLTNNGILITEAILGFTGNTAQVISGSGSFSSGAIFSVSTSFSSLRFSNNSADGVTFTGTNRSAGKISVGDLDLRSGYLNRINIGTDTFSLGGDLSGSSGGITGGTFQRQVRAAGTTLFPFVSAATASASNVRSMYVRHSGLSVISYASVTYVDSVGMRPVAPFIDNGSEITHISNATWRLSHSFGASGQHDITGIYIVGQGIASSPLTQGLRITGDTGSVYTVGKNDYGSGTESTPQANKYSIWYRDIPRNIVSEALHIGVDKAFQTAQSGTWEDGATWVGGISPSVSCSNVIINNGHNVTVNTTAAGAKNLAILEGGELTIQGSNLVVGCDTLRNYQLTNAGTLTITGGTLKVNGSIINKAGNTFVQSGGDIFIDPNDRGNALTSALGDALNFPAVGSGYSLTGGRITIVDPPVPSSARAVASSATAFTAHGTHTLIFGDGISADTANGARGFYFDSGESAMTFQNVIVNGPSTGRRYLTSFGALGILGNLTINPGGWLKIPTVVPGLSVAGNITVNNGGVLDGQGTGRLALQRYVAGVVTPATTAQTLGGGGDYLNDAAVPTANFYMLTINNSSTGGVTIDPLNTIHFNTLGASVSSTVYFTRGMLAMSSGTFIKGTQASGNKDVRLSPGSGIAPGTAYGIWHTGNNTGTINAGTNPTESTAYPFVGRNGEERRFWIKRNSPTADGLIAATYTDAGSTDFDTVNIDDSGYTVDRRLRGAWTISVLSGTLDAVSFTIAATAPASYIARSPADNRLVQISGIKGSHQAGTSSPGAQRNGLSLTDLTSGAFYIGIAAANLVPSSIMSGNWNNASIWKNRTVPLNTDNVSILSSHTVTVDDAGAQCGGLTVYSGGKLQLVNGGSLTVGTTNNNAVLNLDNGDLDVAGGTLQVNGRLETGIASNISQSGGNIIIDGNAGGSATNSINARKPLVYLNTQGNRLALTGGTLTITDPHFNGDALNINISNVPYRSGPNHTVRLGDGVSNDPGNLITGFSVRSQGLKFAFGNLEINTGSSPLRVVNGTFTSSTNFINGNLKVTSGELLCGSALTADTPFSLCVAGNITVESAGKLTSPDTLILAAISNTLDAVPNTNTQIIGGAGIYRNNASSPTANFTSLSNYNSSTGGLVFSFDPTISHNLTLQNGSKMQMNGSGTLLSLGTAPTNPGSLTFDNSATGGRIIGKVRRWIAASKGTYTFPLSADGINNKVPTLEYTVAPGTGGTLTAQFVSDNPGFPNSMPLSENGLINISSVHNGYWQIDAADGLSGGSYTGTFAAYSADLPDYNQAVLLKRPSAGGNWMLEGISVATRGSGANPILQRNDMNGFSQFAIGLNRSVPLPLSLSSLAGYLSGSDAKLNWIVENEQDVMQYELERSSNGIAFVNVFAAKPSGTSGRVQYLRTDPELEKGRYYYRLRVVKKDGSVRNSNTVVLNLAERDKMAINIYPNPTNNYLKMDVPDNLIGTSVILMDMNGRAMQLEHRLSHTSIIDMRAYPTGIYSLKFADGTVVKVTKE